VNAKDTVGFIQKSMAILSAIQEADKDPQGGAAEAQLCVLPVEAAPGLMGRLYLWPVLSAVLSCRYKLLNN
jgi:hypothetical protein